MLKLRWWIFSGATRKSNGRIKILYNAVFFSKIGEKGDKISNAAEFFENWIFLSNTTYTKIFL